MAPVRPSFVQSRPQMTVLTLNQFQHGSSPTSNDDTHRKSLLPSFQALLSLTAPNRYCLTTSFLYPGYLIYPFLTAFPPCQQGNLLIFGTLFIHGADKKGTPSVQYIPLKLHIRTASIPSANLPLTHRSFPLNLTRRTIHDEFSVPSANISEQHELIPYEF